MSTTSITPSAADRAKQVLIGAARVRHSNRTSWSLDAHLEDRLRDAILAAEQAAREKALEDADDAISDVWRNRDGTTKRGCVRYSAGLRKAHDAIRALSTSVARDGKGEGT